MSPRDSAATGPINPLDPAEALTLTRDACYLTGPTAVGKTATALALAERLDAEILALDSMTLYRGLDIGTAKPTPSERARVPHHLLDRLDPWQSASVADYRCWALDILCDLKERGRTALFVGGTPLYLKALLRGLFEGPPADPEIRRRLEAQADLEGDDALHRRLQQCDPEAADRIHPNDRRRLVRALEVFEQTGVPLSQFQAEHERPAPPDVPVLALDRPRAQLHERIDRRVHTMFDEGLVDEVRALLDDPRGLADGPSQAAGYHEVIDLLAGTLDRDGAIARIQARTRQLAKRQITWFRHLEEVRIVPITDLDDPQRLADALAERFTAIRSGPPARPEARSGH